MPDAHHILESWYVDRVLNLGTFMNVCWILLIQEHRIFFCKGTWWCWVL